MTFLHAGIICPLEVLWALPWVVVGWAWFKNKFNRG